MYTTFHLEGETRLQHLDTRKLALASVLGALSAIFEIIPGPPFDIPFPLYNRVSWDITGMPMMVSLLFTGPIGAVYTCLIGCSFIFLRGNLYGGIFKIVAELATIMAFAAMRKGFVSKSVAAVTSRIVVMTVANYYLLPLFYSMPVSFVVGILPALAVMNGTQALINVIPAQLVYNRLRESWLSRLQQPKTLQPPPIKT
jgi:riboflavin transporter FmnP